MTDLAKPEPDPLDFAKDEEASRIQWVLKHVADHGYMPGEPGKPWHGRDTTISTFQEVFGVTDAREAANIVNIAVGCLWSLNQPDDREAQKRLMLERLSGYRQAAIRVMQRGAREMTWKYEDVPDPKTGDLRKTKVPFKQKKIGVTLAALARLTEIEQFEAKLRGLETQGGGDTNIIDSLIVHLDSIADGDKKKKAASSVAQAIKSMPIDQLNDAGQEKVRAMIENLDKRKAKQIESKVKDVGAE